MNIKYGSCLALGLGRCGLLVTELGIRFLGILGVYGYTPNSGKDFLFFKRGIKNLLCGGFNWEIAVLHISDGLNL